MDPDGESELADTGPWVGLPGLDAGPIDHAWLDNGLGVLSCIAGNLHAPDAVAVCPFYLRADVVDLIPHSLWVSTHVPTSLRYQDEMYFKLTSLVRPEHWHDVIGLLPVAHGLRPCAWSVFSALDAAHAVAGYDPRDSLRTVLTAPDNDPKVQLLARLLASLGDPGNKHGSLGITGSVALAPQRIAAASDIDLLVYPSPGRRSDLDAALYGHGAEYLATLVARDDPRLSDYRQSRVMAPVCSQASRDVFWGRRRDVAWIGHQRIDLTWAQPIATVNETLRYERPPVGTYAGELRIRAVTNEFPVLAAVDSPQGVTELHITARGLQDALRPGDLVTVSGNLHTDHNGQRSVAVDDAAGHRLDLTTYRET